MSRALEPPIVNICFDGDIDVIISTKIWQGPTIAKSQSQLFQVGAISTFLLLNLDDMMDVDLGLEHIDVYIFGKHICEQLAFQIWSSYASSRGGRNSATPMMGVSHSELESHLWNLIAWGYWLNIVNSYNRQHPRARKLGSSSWSHSDLLRGSNHLGTLFPFISNWSLTRLACLFLLEIYK